MTLMTRPTSPACLPSDFLIGCEDSGTAGPPLVLLHCSGADRQHWKRMMKAWDGTGRRIIRPELFGCGQTAAWPGDRAVTLDDYAAIASACTADVDEPFDLVGHSMGGAVALRFALTRPERIRTLTLIEPAAFFLLKDRGEREWRLFAEITAVATAVHAGAATPSEAGRHCAMEYFFDYWSTAGRWQTVEKPARDAMAQTVAAISGDFTAAFGETTRLSDYTALAMPVLLVSGGQSPAPVRNIIDALARTLPAAQQVGIPDAGHMMPLTHAALLAGLIRDFQDRAAG